jgi:hypothetical protein
MTASHGIFWSFLKQSHPAIFESVCKRLPQSVLDYYADHRSDPVADTVIQGIDRQIARIPVQKNENESLDVEAIVAAICKEPVDILAYYYMVLPNEVIRVLDRQLPESIKQSVSDALTRLNPQPFSDAMVNRFCAYSAAQQSAGPPQKSLRRKIRLVETLRSLTDGAHPHYLDPRRDLGLFTTDEQVLILHECHHAKHLAPYLLFLDPHEQSQWLAILPNRQRALIRDAMNGYRITECNERDLRNAMIGVIRRLQDDYRINPEIKSC